MGYDDTMEKTGTLTAALEDYLEAIFNLCRFDKAARSRDIAETLNVHKSTVTAALKSLGHMQLINYAPYEAVTLTPEGKKLAKDVARRHAALKDFFVNVLKVDVDTAETAACGMEHAIPREIVHRLAKFAATMRDCPRIDFSPDVELAGTEACADCFERTDEPGAVAEQADEFVTLDSVQPGQTVRVLSVKGGGAVKKRLTEMGLVKGAMLTVERIAPLGDPMDIKLKGCHLSLRKDEAARIYVQKEA